MNGRESINLRCVCEDILFECFFDQGFFTPAVMQYEPHLHAQYEIHIVESGEYELEELNSDKKTVLKGGMVAVIPPNCYHNTVLNTKISSVKANVSRFVIRMDFEKIKNFENALELYEKFKIVLGDEKSILIFTVPDAVNAAQNLYNAFQKTDKTEDFCANAYLKLCMVSVVREALKIRKAWNKEKASGTLKEESRKNKIEKFINENYDNVNLNAGMLEKHLNLSKRQLVRIMIDYYGVPFSKFLVKYRLARAEKLLLRTNLSLEKIAGHIGYESVTGFYLAFKKAYGVSPSAFRKQNTKNDR